MIKGRHIIFAVSLFLSAVAISSGQIAGGLNETTNARMGGNNFIVGMVFWPSGMPVNTRISIRLSTPMNGDIIASTDDSGKFVFSGLAAGPHTLIIEGEPGIEPVREEIDIVRKRSSVPETYALNIRLKEKIEQRSKAKRPAVISSSNAGVPKRAMDLYQKASELANAKDFRGAIEKLDLAVAEYPAFVNAFNEIGVLYLRVNELEKADEALQSALKIKPDAYEPLINRGIALFRLTRFKEAEPILREALKVKAGSTVAHYYLGRAFHKMGRNDEAEAEFLELIKLNPTEFREAYRFLAVIYLDRGDGQRVIEELEQYLHLVPKASDADELRKVIERIKAALKTAESDRKPGL
jgi:Flp pilus assembly protein TadD